MTRRDPIVGGALDQLRVPPHRPGFWEDLGVQVASIGEPTGASTGTVITMAEKSPPREAPRRTRAVAMVAAAAISIAAVAGILAIDDGDGEAPVADDGSSTTVTPESSDGAPVDPAEVDEARQVVVSFLDSVGGGDIEGAAAKVGLVSAQRAEASGGLVDLLGVAAEGHGAWAASQDRTVTAVGLAPGLVVVVVEGTIQVEGSTEHRVAAFPVRKAESADAWLVELWAYDLAGGPSLRLTSPDVDEEELARLGVGEELSVAVAAGGGRAWASFDGDPPVEADLTGGVGTATWTPEGRPELVVVAHQDGAELTALAFRVVRSEG